MTDANGYMFDYIKLSLYNAKSHLVGSVPIPPAPEEKISTFEKLINEPLPDDYRRFLKTINGGTPEKLGVDYFCFPAKWGSNNFTFLPPKEDYGLSILFTLNPEFVSHNRNIDVSEVSYFSLEAKYKEFIDLEDMGYPHVPNDMIPIGSTPIENDMIILGIKGERRGKVYYYMLQEDPETLYQNVGFIADSFDEFLQLIRPCE